MKPSGLSDMTEMLGWRRLTPMAFCMNTEVGADDGEPPCHRVTGVCLTPSTSGLAVVPASMFVSVRSSDSSVVLYSFMQLEVLCWCFVFFFYKVCQKSGGQHQFLFFLINSILNRSCFDSSFVHFEGIWWRPAEFREQNKRTHPRFVWWSTMKAFSQTVICTEINIYITKNMDFLNYICY